MQKSTSGCCPNEFLHLTNLRISRCWKTVFIMQGMFLQDSAAEAFRCLLAWHQWRAQKISEGGTSVITVV